MLKLELDLKKKILIVDMPEDGYFYIDEKERLYVMGELIKGKYKFICKGSELTEEIANNYVDEVFNPATTSYNAYFGDGYKNYKDDNSFYSSAKKSFISAVEAKGFYWLENPLGDYNTVIKRHIVTGTWKEFEDKTFKNPHIFEILTNK